MEKLREVVFLFSAPLNVVVVAVGLGEGEGDGLWLADGLGDGEGLGLEEGDGGGLADADGLGDGLGDTPMIAETALEASTTPYCTDFGLPPWSRPVVGLAVENSAFFRAETVAVGSAEIMSPRRPATMGAEIEVPPTGPYP